MGPGKLSPPQKSRVPTPSLLALARPEKSQHIIVQVTHPKHLWLSTGPLKNFSVHSTELTTTRLNSRIIPEIN